MAELKSRGNQAFKIGNLPTAEVLWGKAIEHDATIQGLFSNRSMVRCTMGKHDEALDDAGKAIEVAPAWPKGHFRRGQALDGLKRYKDAVDAYAKALELEPANKATAKALAKSRAMGERAEKAAGEAAASPERKKTVTKTVVASSSSGSGSGSGSGSTAGASSSSEAKDGTTVLKDFRGDDVIVRGYKQTTSGQTTSYFDTERTAEEKALIGDIAPKRIDPATLAPRVDEGKKGAEPVAGSAWNQGGTYEEKNVSEWARNALEAAMLQASFTAASGEWSVRVAGVKDVEGDAEIIAMRGKRRHMFEFSFTLEWEVTFSDEGKGATVQGTLAFSEVTALDNDDLDAGELLFKDGQAAHEVRSGAELKRELGTAGRGLQGNVAARIQEFVVGFNEL